MQVFACSAVSLLGELRGDIVERPIKLSLDDLRALPSRSQITPHDCVEVWTCIAIGGARNCRRC
ncbi:MAG TPA: hypothetical protein VGG86_13660 [Roseiarcus sp.]|jgi:hypothetical protein